MHVVGNKIEWHGWPLDEDAGYCPLGTEKENQTSFGAPGRKGSKDRRKEGRKGPLHRNASSALLCVLSRRRRRWPTYAAAYEREKMPRRSLEFVLDGRRMDGRTKDAKNCNEWS